MAKCLHCGVEFRPRRRGHVFCSSFCRHRGERRPEEPAPVDQAQLRRLFDSFRSPDERVCDDDWHPSPQDSPWRNLDACQTVGKRRGWYLTLIERPPRG